MKIALTGKTGCGRSTLFRALAGSSDVDTGKPLTVQVPDERLDFLTAVHMPEKKVNATVVFYDVPSPSFSPGNMAVMRNAAVLAAVLDNYALGDLVADFSEIESELILSDMNITEKRLARLRKESKGKSREAILLERILAHMETGQPIRTISLDRNELDLLSPYAPLSLKPLLVVPNRMGEPVTPEDALRVTDIEIDDRQEFLESMGYSSSGLSRLIRESYSALDLIVFYTIGKDEVRAWPLRHGATAPEAAGSIHSDFARGFIRAIVMPYELYHEFPDRAILKDRGELRIEGKNYVVQDGDIIEIRFNV
jgi:ribosome-binding ATPase YchF (GTP1/OBG family)